MRSNLFGDPVSRSGEVLGCGACPLNGVPGIHKVKGLERVRGRKAMAWAMCPGERENELRLELVGRAGDLLWRGLKAVGVSRADVDVQNVVRCRPTDGDGRNRDPSKQELKCCSVYNDEALERNKGMARVHLILGDVAAAQLLGKGYRKDKPVFWHDAWNAYVVLDWHPSYILRKGGEGAGWDYFSWRDRLRAVRAAMDNPGRWGYARSRGYKVVRRIAEFDLMERAIRAEQAAGRRVSFDVEDGEVGGKRAMLLAGFGIGHFSDPRRWDSWRGQCWSVALDHPEARHEPAHAAELKRRVRKLLEDAGIKKALQNGSYDSDSAREHLGARLRGYDYDTQYGTYLRYSFLRSCSLENMTYRFFPEFADYKDCVAEWDGNFARAPLERLVLRNCGDCDVTKRLEEKFAPQVSYPLVQVYIHAGLTLDRMEHRGPLLDWKAWEQAKSVVPKLAAKIDRQLQQVTGVLDFNARSHDQVAWLIYDKLKIPQTEAGRSTSKDVLTTLFAETGNPVLERVVRRRAIGIIESTFLDGYAASARLHGGELRTVWWLTGAETGRLRSGRGDKAELLGIINFQNLHGNVLLQNLLVSDPNWREALAA